jgi:hypothetical protein
MVLFLRTLHLTVSVFVHTIEVVKRLRRGSAFQRMKEKRERDSRTPDFSLPLCARNMRKKAPYAHIANSSTN